MNIITRLVSLCILTSSFYAFANWPPKTSSLVPGNGLEYPIKLDSVNDSLETMLNSGAKVISSYIANDGPIVTIKYQQQYIICVLKGAGIGSDQNVTTSKCYALN